MTRSEKQCFLKGGHKCCKDNTFFRLGASPGYCPGEKERDKKKSKEVRNQKKF